MQFPLSIELRPSTQRKAVQSLVETQIARDRLCGREATGKHRFDSPAPRTLSTSGMRASCSATAGLNQLLLVGAAQIAPMTATVWKVGGYPELRQLLEIGFTVRPHVRRQHSGRRAIRAPRAARIRPFRLSKVPTWLWWVAQHEARSIGRGEARRRGPALSASRTPRNGMAGAFKNQLRFPRAESWNAVKFTDTVTKKHAHAAMMIRACFLTRS